MRLEEKNKHERDGHVELDPGYDENHIYLIKGKSHLDEGYLSVTTFLGQFFESFDPEAIVNKNYDRWQETEHPKYFGKSKESIIDGWKQNGIEASERGTHMHASFEDYVNDDDFDIDLAELGSFINWYELEVEEPFRTEYTVYGEDEKIVGNIDFIYKNKDGELCIVDYKCSGIPSRNAYGKKCKVMGLPDTKIAKNTLQLNVYKYLLEKYYGLEIKHLYNLYIKDYNCQFVEQDILDMSELFE